MAQPKKKECNFMKASIRVVIAGAVVGVACSADHALPANYAPTQAQIGAAEAVGAHNQPRAALHLKMARDEVAQAQELARRGDDREATRMLDRARTDAEMALMITREATARTEANQSERELQGLAPGAQKR